MLSENHDEPQLFHKKRDKEDDRTENGQAGIGEKPSRSKKYERTGGEKSLDGNKQLQRNESSC